MPQCKLDVTLEPLSAAYLNQVERLWSDPAVIRYTSIRTPCTREAAAERLSNLSGRPTVFAVLHAGKFCGVAGCLPAEEETFGLFYQLLPSYWGQGVGRAAAEMVLEALRRLSPSATVCADVVAENTASIRILEGLGFRRVRTSAPDGGCGRLAIWEYQRSFGNQEEECL